MAQGEERERVAVPSGEPGLERDKGCELSKEIGATTTALLGQVERISVLEAVGAGADHETDLMG